MKDLSTIKLKNQLILELYSNYLNNNPKTISKKMVEDLSESCHIAHSESLFLLLVAEFGLDIVDNNIHKDFAYEYIKPYLHQLPLNEYLTNPYYQNVKPEKIKKGKWEITYQTYSPYELFVWKDLTIASDYSEYPNIGYFEEPFKYLTVLENNREWMTITPNEIETMKDAVNKAYGNVVTFGLGLGYFAYMVSLKSNVKKVTIIEKDQTVIDLFNSNILPFFEYQDKIEIIKMDAVAYLQQVMMINQYDFAFVDLWHDVSDAIELYLKIKNIEIKFNHTNFMYWIEESIISYLRWYLYDNFELLKSKKLIDSDQISVEMLDKKSILRILKN